MASRPLWNPPTFRGPPLKLWTHRDSQRRDALDLQHSRLQLEGALLDRTKPDTVADYRARVAQYEGARDAFLRLHNRGVLPGNETHTSSSASSSALWGGGGSHVTASGDVLVTVHPRSQARYDGLAARAAQVKAKLESVDVSDLDALEDWQAEARAYNEELDLVKDLLAPDVAFPFVDTSSRQLPLPRFEVPAEEPGRIRGDNTWRGIRKASAEELDALPVGASVQNMMTHRTFTKQDDGKWQYRDRDFYGNDLYKSASSAGVANGLPKLQFIS